MLTQSATEPNGKAGRGAHEAGGPEDQPRTKGPGGGTRPTRCTRGGSKTTRGKARRVAEVAPNPTRREASTRQVRSRAERARKPGEALSAQDPSQGCGRSGTQRAKDPGRGRKPGSGPKPWESPDVVCM